MILRMQSLKPTAVALTFLTFLIGSFLFYSPSLTPVKQTLPLQQYASPPQPSSTAVPSTTGWAVEMELLQYFEDYPLSSPHKNNFGELGRRTRLLRDLIVSADREKKRPRKQALLSAVNRLAVLLYFFLQNSPQNPQSALPFSDLRASMVPKSAGIVIPAGDYNLRFAAHLICCLRNVLKSKLPIQIVFAGDDDLSPTSRDFLTNLPNFVDHAPSLEFLDITSVFNDTTLKMKEGGWAIKPFAALGSKYEKVIVMDADSVFLQKPEVLLHHPAFERTGAFLFHDRLLWQHGFQERHDWWRSQIKRPSATLDKSLVWKEDYAEEVDSGVVIIDKSRIDVLVGLLHVCWQNSYEVREEVTYKMTYGDKESWWMGFELAGSTYEMEEHYGAIVGWEDTIVTDPAARKVCSFVIAHLDDKNELLWYNGGLLKNKQVPSMSHEYAVPDKWMVDAEWRKGATKPDMSCMVGGEVHNLPINLIGILESSIAEAKWVDEALNITQSYQRK
ncbi:hypothetical protein N0V93_004022 [Gnomoniopsis smithogilvyi]|uniref:Alpha-1,3-mannosyltransferase n=1 Tax=Gnomoniopsis smithogilvyi TaxID=1191159 RepID=A0A9W8YY74_9PEZI|nr:hypothetical protein N0V93_004022 [Gnomoniopsis smithogilvyi]